jgi:hypothetical protein
MILAQIAERPRTGILGLLRRRRPGDPAHLYRLRRYEDDSVNVQSWSSASTPTERDDVVVKIASYSFETRLDHQGISTADCSDVDLAIAASWRISDPEQFVMGLADLLRQNTRIETTHVAAYLQRKYRQQITEAISRLQYAELKQGSHVALAALDKALRGRSPGVELTAVAIAGLASAHGEAWLAAEDEAKAQRRQIETAIAAAKVEAERTAALARLEKEKQKLKDQRLQSLIKSQQRAGTPTTSRERLAQIARNRALEDRVQMKRLIAIEPRMSSVTIGEPTSYRVVPDNYGYVYLFVNGSSGRTLLLMPNEALNIDNAPIVPGRPIIFPPPEFLLITGAAYLQQGPEGKETAIAFLSKAPLLTDEEVRSVEPHEGSLPERLVDAIIERLLDPGEVWAADILEYEVGRKHPGQPHPGFESHSRRRKRIGEGAAKALRL